MGQTTLPTVNRKAAAVAAVDVRMEIPVEAAMVMSAMEAGRGDEEVVHERRQNRRMAHRTVASLWLFSDPPTAPPHVVYTRDASRRGLGFITDTPLPLGHGGIVELVAPDGTVMNVHCTLLRCRQAVGEWYEGNLHFNRDQPEFDGE